MSIFSKYYYNDLNTFFHQIIPSDCSFIKIGNSEIKKNYDYILLSNSLAYVNDAQLFIAKLKQNCHSRTRVIVVYYNFLWKPLLYLASLMGLRKKEKLEPNWFSSDDINNIFSFEGFEEVKRGKRLLLPLNLGFVSTFINRFLAQLPIINFFCLTTYQVFKIKGVPKPFSVSIIIPARNEVGNIKGIMDKIPKLSKKSEIIFVEGNSKDATFSAIREEINNYQNAFLFKQKGKGKGDAVRLGMKKARNKILMILDADLTVDPKDLKKFYRALSDGICEFANGSRLVYPMERQAMRSFNYLGNKLFSLMFTFMLDQKIKDTLCGTKALFREDYLKIEKNRKSFGNFDPFGDFDLLFGASKLNLKIMDIPIRYKERTYGSTNISRFRHALLLTRMVIFAANKIKFN